MQDHDSYITPFDVFRRIQALRVHSGKVVALTPEAGPIFTEGGWNRRVVQQFVFLVVILYGFITAAGFFNLSAYSEGTKVLALIPLVSSFLYCLFKRMWREGSPAQERLLFGLAAIITAKAFFFCAAGEDLHSFPMDVFLLVILVMHHPPAPVLYALTIIAINTGHAYLTDDPFPIPETAYEALSLLAVLFALQAAFSLERRARSRAEERLAGIESLAARISDESGIKERRPNLSISEEAKDSFYLDSALRLSKALSNTICTIRDVTGSFSCCLFIVDDEGFKLFAASSDSRNLIYEIPPGKSGNMLEWIVNHGESLKIHRSVKGVDPGYYSKGEEITSFMGLPVQNDDGVSGAVLCMDRKGRPFTKEEERLLKMAAEVAAEYLRNSAMLDRMRIEAREFHAFYRLVKMLAESLDRDAILKTALDLCREIVDYDLAAIALMDDDGKVRFYAAKGKGAADLVDSSEDVDLGVIGWVMRKKRTYHYYGSEKVQLRKIFSTLPPPLAKMGSFLCLPLIVQNEVIGVFLTSRKDRKAFTPYEIKLFEAMAAHVAVAVFNAGVYMKMESMAITDGLTGLYNHRHFQERLSKEVERVERYRDSFALLLVDVDHFKSVNDEYGHPAGDKLLKGVTQVLLNAVRGVDFVSRYGGEEFAVILIHAGRKDALEIAERIRASIEGTSFDLGEGRRIGITVSIGVANFPDDADSQRLLISRADAALYLAKNEGRNRVYAYNDVKSRIE